jgi:hypothetical protein
MAEEYVLHRLAFEGNNAELAAELGTLQSTERAHLATVFASTVVAVLLLLTVESFPCNVNQQVGDQRSNPQRRRLPRSKKSRRKFRRRTWRWKV